MLCLFALSCFTNKLIETYNQSQKLRCCQIEKELKSNEKSSISFSLNALLLSNKPKL